MKMHMGNRIEVSMAQKDASSPPLLIVRVLTVLNSLHSASFQDLTTHYAIFTPLLECMS